MGKEKVKIVIIPEWDYKQILEGKECYLSLEEGNPYHHLNISGGDIYTLHYSETPPPNYIWHKGGEKELEELLTEALFGTTKPQEGFLISLGEVSNDAEAKVQDILFCFHKPFLLIKNYTPQMGF